MFIEELLRNKVQIILDRFGGGGEGGAAGVVGGEGDDVGREVCVAGEKGKQKFGPRAGICDIYNI